MSTTRPTVDPRYARSRGRYFGVRLTREHRLLRRRSRIPYVEYLRQRKRNFVVRRLRSIRIEIFPRMLRFDDSNCRHPTRVCFSGFGQQRRRLDNREFHRREYIQVLVSSQPLILRDSDIISNLQNDFSTLSLKHRRYA